MLQGIIPAALADHLWQSTMFGVAAAVLASALRKNRAETRYWLWLAASLKFLIPFSILIAVGSAIQWPSSAPVVRSPLSVAVQEVGQPFAVSSASFSDQAPGATDNRGAIQAIVLAVWLCGFAVVMGVWARNWLRIHAIVRCAKRVDLGASIPVLGSESSLELGVFGIFRPVLLLPVSILEHLEPAHLRAIVSHELCHVRRRDNLAAAVHRLVQAVFWFHPLVWWVGARMMDERERACDEEVLRSGNQARVYAESILRTCQFFVQSPSICMSGVTGADLKKRIKHIMCGGSASRLTVGRKVLLASTAAAALGFPIAVGLLNAAQNSTEPQAQDNAKPVTFEVASIKPTAPGGRSGMFLLRPGGRLRTEGMTTKVLIEMAYDLKDAQVEGGPSWINSERYDVDAKPDDSVAGSLDKLPPDKRKQMLGEMMRSLLRDRFKLVLGHATKELPVYILVPAGSGAKLKAADPKVSGHTPDPPAAAPHGRLAGEQPGIGGEGLMMNGPGHMQATGAEMPMLVGALSLLTHRVVIDKTGLTGAYDFTLNWTPDEMQLRDAGPVGPRGSGGAGALPSAESNGPDLFAALQEQLGLKLKPQKTRVDIRVIEHVEKPSQD